MTEVEVSDEGICVPDKEVVDDKTPQRPWGGEVALDKAATAKF